MFVKTGVWGKKYLLRCPVCGFDYNHQKGVETYERFGGEDGPSVKLRPGSSEIVLSRKSENPSPRRHATRLHFEGECGHSWVMDIIQHKGQTFIDYSLE